MKLAAVGVLDGSGPGNEMADALRQLSFSSVYIDQATTRMDLVPISAWYLPKYADPALDMRKFLDLHRPDVVVTWGRTPHAEFVRIWKERGVRWVHVTHWDLFDPRADFYSQATLIAPNSLCQRSLKELGFRSILLPIPVDTDRFAFRERTQALTFLSIYGSGGLHCRRGLPELLLAWWEMEEAPPLVIRARHVPVELDHCLPPETVTVEAGTSRAPEDLYRGMDVAVQVSRYEGVGMSILEAMSSGLPVITTQAEPMSELAPGLVVPPEGTIRVRLNGKDVMTSVVSVPRLKERVQSIRKSDISELSRRARALVEERYSWTALRGKWTQILK